MSNVIVTGGAGFVGSSLVARLRQDNHNVIVIDDYSAGKLQNVISGVRYIHDHTKNINTYNDLSEIEAVFHLGEYSRIHPSFEECEKVWDSNINGTFQVLNFCKRRNVKIVYAASSTRFAVEGVDHSPYSFTKSTNIDFIKAFSKWYGLKYSICYFYNVFGPGYDSSPVPGYESVISVFEKQYKANQPITVVGDGSQRRMFTYVGDIVDGLIKAWKYHSNDEFDLGNPIKSYSILEIAHMFSNNIEFVPARKGDRLDSCLTHYEDTCSKLDWKPTMSVEEWIKAIKK